jgi:tRNA modification GTPase
MDGTTIVAPATVAGTGAVAVVRLSGPGAFPVAAGLTGREAGSLPPRTLVPCGVRLPDGKTLDRGLIAIFPAPASYTGEDVVELHLHGNPFLVETVCAGAVALGAVPASPGEFTRRAYLNGKLDLTQAEAVADLIAARTGGAAAAAVRQLRGGIGETIAPLREILLGLLLRLEGAIDFSGEEDIPESSAGRLLEEIGGARGLLSQMIGSWTRGHRFRDGATVVIAGVANVGKSRLLNRLLGEERAIVAEVPGTTRDYLYGETTLAGFPVRIVDTAGLREPADPVEAEGVRRSREQLAAADLALFVLDGSRAADDDDRAAYAEAAGTPHFLVVNKDDLPSREAGDAFAGIGLKGRARLSAKTGEGVDALLVALARELFPPDDPARDAAPLTRLRHRAAAEGADAALSRAEGALSSGLPLECVAADVRDAVRALSGLTGAIAPDEVLDAIFDRFCVGK